jgi:hypothetical protein
VGKLMDRRFALVVVALAVAFGVTLACVTAWHVLPPPLPKLHEEGQEVVVHIAAGYEDGTGIQGAKVLFTEETTGSSWIRVTDEHGVASLSLRCGSNYVVNAEFQESSKEVTHEIEGEEIVGVLISADNVIESIVFEPAVLYP